VILGAVSGYLTQIGYTQTFWSFVAGHSSLELLAIVISGAAGLRLGMAVIAPGNVSRRAALVAAAKPAVRLMYGAADDVPCRGVRRGVLVAAHRIRFSNKNHCWNFGGG
jgi:hypothetical protein